MSIMVQIPGSFPTGRLMRNAQFQPPRPSEEMISQPVDGDSFRQSPLPGFGGDRPREQSLFVLQEVTALEECRDSTWL